MPVRRRQFRKILSGVLRAGKAVLGSDMGKTLLGSGLAAISEMAQKKGAPSFLIEPALDLGLNLVRDYQPTVTNPTFGYMPPPELRIQSPLQEAIAKEGVGLKSAALPGAVSENYKLRSAVKRPAAGEYLQQPAVQSVQVPGAVTESYKLGSAAKRAQHGKQLQQPAVQSVTVEKKKQKQKLSPKAEKIVQEKILKAQRVLEDPTSSSLEIASAKKYLRAAKYRTKKAAIVV